MYVSGARAIVDLFSGLYQPGVGPIYLDEVRCTGSEQMLVNCSASGVGQHNCVHNEDAGVRCEGTNHLREREKERERERERERGTQ